MTDWKHLVPYQDREWFEEQFIFQGKSISKIARELGMDWTSIDAWRSKHGLPRHLDRDQLLADYGEDVADNIRQHRSSVYAASNKVNWANKSGKTLEELYGPEIARERVEKMRKSLKGIKRTEAFKSNLSMIRRGVSNPNFGGGFFSGLYPDVDRAAIAGYVAACFNKRAVFERNFTCAECGVQSISNMHGHHLLPFSLIFGAVCMYAEQNDCLTTLWVLNEMFRFHDQHLDVLYCCLCEQCHRDIHRRDNDVRRKRDRASLMMLLDTYMVNPEPSLSHQEGAETIEHLNGLVE